MSLIKIKEAGFNPDGTIHLIVAIPRNTWLKKLIIYDQDTYSGQQGEDLINGSQEAFNTLFSKIEYTGAGFVFVKSVEKLSDFTDAADMEDYYYDFFELTTTLSPFNITPSKDNLYLLEVELNEDDLTFIDFSNSQCGEDSIAATLPVYDLFSLRQKAIYLASNISDCDIPKSLTNALLILKTIELSIFCQDWTAACEYWKKFFGTLKGSTVTSHCGCRG